VLSTPWYNGDVLSPEHIGCSHYRKLCWLQLDHFAGGQWVLFTGKEVCCVACCMPKWAAAHTGPSSLETETQDIIQATQKMKSEFHQQWKRKNRADRGGLNINVHAW